MEIEAESERLRCNGDVKGIRKTVKDNYLSANFIIVRRKKRFLEELHKIKHVRQHGATQRMTKRENLAFVYRGNLCRTYYWWHPSSCGADLVSWVPQCEPRANFTKRKTKNISGVAQRSDWLGLSNHGANPERFKNSYLQHHDQTGLKAQPASYPGDWEGGGGGLVEEEKLKSVAPFHNLIQVRNAWHFSSTSLMTLCHSHEAETNSKALLHICRHKDI